MIRHKIPTCDCDFRLGVVALSCNPVTWRPELVDGVRLGNLVWPCPWRTGVRTKQGVNMGGPGEPGTSRLSKEGRIGPGRWRSRQKSPCPAVVGSRLWVDSGQTTWPIQLDPILLIIILHGFWFLSLFTFSIYVFKISVDLLCCYLLCWYFYYIFYIL